MFKTHKPLIISIIILSLIAFPEVDLYCTRYFYSDQEFSTFPLFNFLYRYAEYPAQVIAISAGIIYLFSFPSFSVYKWRQPLLYLFLTLALGAFALNELTLKNNWGRPRPKQTTEFGGTQNFRPFYQPNIFHQPEPSRSFPCGHCTAGFYFFAFYFLAKRLSYSKTSYLCLTFALGSGFLIGLARIAQGGHFFSDVIFGALVMWFTACALDKLLLP